MNATVGIYREESGRATDLAGRSGNVEGVLGQLEVRRGGRRPAIGQDGLRFEHRRVFAIGYHPRSLLHPQPVEDAGPGGVVLEQALHLSLGVALSNLDGCASLQLH